MTGHERRRSLRGAPCAAALLLALPAVACARSPELARGPIEVTQVPTTISLRTPTATEMAGWEVCYEFDLPGDSQETSQIRAVLLGASGERRPVSGELDRRGESAVCRSETIPPAERSTRYVALELTSSAPLTVRHVRGGPIP